MLTEAAAPGSRAFNRREAGRLLPRSFLAVGFFPLGSRCQEQHLISLDVEQND